MTIRRQASLWVKGVPEIERMRYRFNRAQAQLIPAHVTLIREDEVTDWELLESRIRKILPIELTLSFGRPVRDLNFVYLPVESGITEFDNLRHLLLSDGATTPRKQMPHMTIVHPRNGICSDAAFEEIAEQIPPCTIVFREIHLIEQINGGSWSPFAELLHPTHL